jgi:hypothetical protein
VLTCSTRPPATATISADTRPNAENGGSTSGQPCLSNTNAFAVMMDAAKTRLTCRGSNRERDGGLKGTASRAENEGSNVISAFDWGRKTWSPWITTFCRWAEDPQLLIKEEPDLYVRPCSLSELPGFCWIPLGSKRRNLKLYCCYTSEICKMFRSFF